MNVHKKAWELLGECYGDTPLLVLSNAEEGYVDLKTIMARCLQTARQRDKEYQKKIKKELEEGYKGMGEAEFADKWANEEIK